MQKWVISANSKIYNHAEAFKEFGYIDWVQNANYSVGDEVYIYCTRPYKRIMYKTQVKIINMKFDEITDDRKFWNDTNKYEEGRNRLYARLKLIEQADNINLSLEKLQTKGLSAAPQGPVKMKEELSVYVDSFLHDTLEYSSIGEEEIPSHCYEGAKHTILVNKYERSSIARMKCIEKYGCRCLVCGVDFEKIYGDLGKGFIHVHHLVPISTIGKEYKVDYEKDLLPVCPNCHAMLHRKKLEGDYLTVEELKDVIENHRETWK